MQEDSRGEKGRAGSGPGLRSWEGKCMELLGAPHTRANSTAHPTDSPCILAAAITSPAEMLDTLTR